jgi:predicted  nucleic acid-binding Zn-ribbon protein
MSANKALRRLARRIEELKNDIFRLEEQYQENEHYCENRIGEMRASADRMVRNANYEMQKAEESARDKEYEARNIARRLQSARERGDSYDCDRYLRRLRNL